MLSKYESVEDALPADVCADLRIRKQEADLEFLREDISSLLSESKEGVTRVTKIVKDLKDFSHVDNEDEWQWADLHGGIDSTLNIVWNELKYKCEVKKEYGVLPEIQCLPSQLNQVFMNMLINAGHAIVERGTIVIRTGVAAEQVWVEIEDSGKGIAPEHVQKIFDPFFTTKPVGKGTGLGLSLAYGIVQKHRGRIEVKSVPEKGTTFRVWLPQRQTAEAAPAAAASIVAAPA
jgi:signal transduction histidine kinase